MDAASRKRMKESVSSSQSDVPNAKKKKLTSKAASPPAPLKDEGGASAQLTVENVAAEGTARLAAAKKKSPPKLPKNRYLKPQPLSRGSWMTHVASLVVHRCAQQAESCGLDPRDHLNEINWSQMLDGLLRPEDLHLIWYFIRREYSENSIVSILDSTQPYSDLSFESLNREEIRMKYKDALPKPPLSPYMIFMKSKHPKVKRKYPNLQMTEVAMKLGRKWSALSEEKKMKYKQQHAMLKAAYNAQLKSFYEEHPEAKLPTKTPTPSKSRKTVAQAQDETEEEKLIKMLKAKLPKQPLSAYLHFCKKKREKLHRKHPEMPPNAVTVKLGKRWKSMDEEARGKYVKLNEASVQQYKEALAQFNSEHPEAQGLLAKARKMKRKPKAASKQPSSLAVEEGEAGTSSPPTTKSLQPTTLTSPPTLPATPATAAGGEGLERGRGEGDEEDEEVLASTVFNRSNGKVEEEEGSEEASSNSDSESSDSSTED